MGGFGSGWRYPTSRDTTEESRPLDIRKLHRAGGLKRGQAFNWQWTIWGRTIATIKGRVELRHVVLSYRYRETTADKWLTIKQPIFLDYTSCNYGGTRPWWRCPDCRRRVAIVYGPGKYFACRHCYQLAYVCQRETASDRAARRASKIRERLGWEPGILDGEGGKPKGMCWSTFQRLKAKQETCVSKSISGAMQRMPMLNVDA